MKDIKTKPKTTTKAAQNAPKSVIRSPDETVRDIKTVAKDTLVRNAIDKQLETRQSNEPQRAEVEATEQVESAYYSAADTVYQKGKSFVENKLKQHRQQVKTRESQNADIPHTPQNEGVPEVQNPPKQTNNAPKTKESVQADKSVSAIKETPKPQSKATAQVKTKEAYIQAQKVENKTADKTVDTVKTKANYIKQHKTAEVKDGIKQKLPVSAPKTRENTALSSSAVPKTKEQAVTDARKKYVSEKLKTKSDIEKAAQESRTEGVPITDYQPKNTEMTPANENIPKQQTQAVKSATPTPKVKTKNSVDTAFPSKSMPKTKESYIRSQGKTPADIIKTPDKAKAVPKQNTHTVTRNVSSNAKKAVKTKDSFSNGASRAVKTGNSYVGKAAKQKSVKIAKRAAKTQKEITKKAAKQAAKQTKQAAQKAGQTAKATAKAAVEITVKVAQMVVAATKAIISALAALGGWALLLVALIIVIVVAAIAASPFGIFISEEVTETGTIPLSQIISEYNIELTQAAENIELSVEHTEVEVIDNQTNVNIVIAVFAAKTAGAEDNTAEDVVVFDDAKAEKLKEYFREANTIQYTVEETQVSETETAKKLTVTISGKTKEQLMDEYGLTIKQREAVETLLEHGDVLTASSHSLAITNADVQSIINGLPSSLPQKRKDVVKNAGSLVGKVNYFWGGKSSAIGWDSAWGSMCRVTAAGSPSSGTIRAYGLDCSGFVSWAFNNSGMYVGDGTYGQRDRSTLVSASTVQAGDLAFLPSYSHVGIVVGQDTSGNILVIHCSSSANNVVVSTASSVGFTVFRRPNCY